MTIFSLKLALEKVLPSMLWKPLKMVLTKIYLSCLPYLGPYYNFVRWRYKRIVKIFQQKKTLKVVFFIIHESIWKYEGIYTLMEKDERFDPVLIVCPYTDYGQETVLREMEQTYASFKQKGYKVLKTFNCDENKWLDVKKEVKPDLIFFSSPWQITKNKYYILNYLNYLTYYVPYGICAVNQQQTQFNQLFHNLVWASFYETPIHKLMARKYAVNKGKNVFVYGYPMCDIFIDKSYKPKDGWKVKNASAKRIIWAPHHSIEDNPNEMRYSNFLVLHQFMYDLIKIYSGKIQIAFKPHPILKPKLYEHPDWGKERTDNYYCAWQNCDYGQLEEGLYEDLFLTSDAMILDSISFISEYLCLNKPIIFVTRDETINSEFNEFGELAFKMMYKANNQKDLINFVEETIFAGQDPLFNERKLFVEKLLTPPNNMSASENIMYHIKKELLHEVHI